MKKSLLWISCIGLGFSFAEPGNPWFGGARWGFPLGLSVDGGYIIPQQKNACDYSDFGNICMGYSLSGEIGTNGIRTGAGWSFLWGYGKVFGLGTELSYLQQFPLIEGAPMGPWNQLDRKALGIDLAISTAYVNLRIGPYFGIDESHRGDFLFRFGIGAGF